MSSGVRNILPSMTGLRAFEASARHRSFTRAAIELNLTQSAVSHQIRKLEDLLGARLFDRVGNEIQVTDTGAEFYNVARATISELRLATDRAARHARDPLLTIGVLGTFAVKCLFPNLNDFLSSNPDILLRLRILQPSPDAMRDDCDFAILYGSDGDWPELEATRITTEELFPVCSPSLLEGPIGLESPDDLMRHTIIRTTSPLILRDDWPFWLRRAGIGDLQFSREISCDLLYPSYQLAIDGVGVALGRSAVVEGDIAAGRLVEPFSVRLRSPLGYHIVHPPLRGATPKIERFIAWAREKFASRL